MKTRCKFVCQSVKLYENNQEVSMTPVTGGSDEDNSFWEATPGGSLELSVVNKKIKFEPGKSYYLDIVPA